MITIQQMKRDDKTEDKFSRANSRKLFQAFPADSKYRVPSSSSSEYSKSSESLKHNSLKHNSQQVTTPRHSRSSETLKHNSQQVTTPRHSRSSVAKPNKPLTNSNIPVMCNNEVVVFDVNDTAALHSLIARNGAWFLDVNDLDAMDKETTFQYVAMRPSPHSELVLTRVPELRHLIYAKFDEEGRPYPIQMRKVSRAKYLAKIEEITTEEERKENKESKEFQANNSSFWEALSVTLKQSIMVNEEPQNEEAQNEE